MRSNSAATLSLIFDATKRLATPLGLILRPHPALLEREDRLLVAWYHYIYAPRTGGAYDSHHRTTRVAGCTRRRGGCMAARGAGAAGGDAGGRLPPPSIGSCGGRSIARIPPRLEGGGLCRWRERGDR